MSIFDYREGLQKRTSYTAKSVCSSQQVFKLMLAANLKVQLLRSERSCKIHAVIGVSGRRINQTTWIKKKKRDACVPGWSLRE